MLKINPDKSNPALPKPYLISQHSMAILPQDQENLRAVEPIDGKVAGTQGVIIANPT